MIRSGLGTGTNARSLTFVRIPIGEPTANPRQYAEMELAGAFLTPRECRLVLWHTAEEQDHYEAVIAKIRSGSEDEQ